MKKKKYSKKAKEIISSMSKDFTVAVEDGSIFVHDTMISPWEICRMVLVKW